jgi:RNA polymerase sigma-70 factor (ECF subfamily)
MGPAPVAGNRIAPAGSWRIRVSRSQTRRRAKPAEVSLTLSNTNSKLVPTQGTGREMTNRLGDLAIKGTTAGEDCGRTDHADVAALIAAIQAGQNVEANFRILFDRYYTSVRRFFARKGFSADDTLDLTQETFLGIYTGMKSFRREGPFEAWLYTIAGNIVRKRLRARATAMRSGLEISTEEAAVEGRVVTAAPQPLEEAIREDRRAALRQAIAELPDQARKCLTLRIYHELTYDEIAVVMRLKIDTVKAHLFQARERVKQRLRDFAFDEVQI